MSPFRPFTHRLSFFVLIALLISSAVSVTPVLAADQTVMNTNNLGTGSLRKAIDDVHPGGKITFDPSLSGQTINLSAELVINKNLTIDASSLAAPITISGNNAVRVFFIDGATVTLKSLTIVAGNIIDFGGGIFNTGDLTLENCTLTGNEANIGGGIANAPNGTLELVESTLASNTAKYGGGIYNWGDLTVRLASNLYDNTAEDGAGIYNAGVLGVFQSGLSGNVASQKGGGLYNSDEARVSMSGLSGNVAKFGGGIYNDTTGDLEIRLSSFRENWVFSFGGGVINYNNMASYGVLFSNNHSEWSGGAIMNLPGASLEIQHNHFIDNEAQFGAGISNLGNLQLFSSTLTGNSAILGGGIYNDPHAYAKIINCTLSGNSASDKGGGILNTEHLVLHNVTLAENTAGNQGGGIYNNINGKLHFGNTIIANSTPNDCVNDGLIPINANNLVMDGTCHQNAVNFINAHPKLGPLANNGSWHPPNGTMLTHALLPSSPAIDAGDPLFCPAEDQRNVPRPFGTGCDIGAFEYNPAYPAIGFMYFMPVIVK